MTERRHIGLKTKLAAALLELVRWDEERGQLAPIIPYEDAKNMSEDHILSLFEWDHWPIRKEAGGPDEPWNLKPRPILEHRAKTAKEDAPAIAKQKRIWARLREHQDHLDGKPKAPSRWPQGRKIQNRPFSK